MSTTLAWTIVSLSRERLSRPRRTRLVADAGTARTIAARPSTQGKTRRLNNTATSTTRRIARCLEHPKVVQRADGLRSVSHHHFGKTAAIRQGLARWG